MKRIITGAILIATAVGCNKPAVQAAEFEAIPVERRDILLRVSAAGAIQPVLAVDVKSKASGEIIGMHVQSGADVRAGTLLAEVDPRIPRSAVEQALANLNMAQAQSDNARVQFARADTLFQAQAITETEYEAARLANASATAGVVRARADLQLARDALNDTRLVAPINGTIIDKYVELGTVISSPTKDVGGGTVIFTMANLDTVQLQAMVDETDIGRVHAGVPVAITVDAYPHRPFEGKVLKIEPKAQVRQNVTMFPVLVNIVNPGHLLKPGMNAEIEINVGERHNVLAIPNAALRNESDIGAAANWLGLDKKVLRRRLSRADPRLATATEGETSAHPAADPPSPPKTEESPPDTTGAEQRVTFVLRNGRATPVHVLVGLTDLDYIEVLRGLTDRDTVLVLPTTGLVNDLDKQQKKAQARAGPGVRQQ
ncbi:MAG TPA: efflux RND transporter periplasmic adaptor subunit [Gemmatimonadales bacterium]|jgi:HlyD family secretion protein